MKKGIILTASIISTQTAGEYQWIESSELENTESWGGDVESFINNCLDLEDFKILEIATIHNLPENAIIIGEENGTPREIYWWKE